MNENLYHNQKTAYEDIEIDNNFQKRYNSKNPRVDVNMLLNRVQLVKKKENKKKVLFIALTFLIIAGTAIFMIYSN
tara:strand:- start:202 stop:429 length:228 start_codon:yes stop_codon:yes gene_type:complete